ncbi:hypothetical protein HYN59_14910 [Flavobacterium album]|uniref:NERD domain-containing protein n=1 Tax=Flavobacterium album TaxID=2175091 RepID=A0A2S1R111_9FLAO|nr:hypothetical protein [Flavobacterium album]AWH86317.1 hypothetical protein HYN59_14910 [Flavobacterium album]
MENRRTVPKELYDNYNLLLKYKDNRRTQEEIYDDLLAIVKDTEKGKFLPFVMQMMNMIGLRHTTDMYKNLMSPLKQFAYVIDVYFSTVHSQGKAMPDENEWTRLTELLMETEMTYFGEIGFPTNESDFDLEKVSVSMKSFFDFYSNAQLSYDEQTLGRLRNNFEKFDTDIKSQFGFTVSDIVTFCHHAGNLCREKAEKTQNSASYGWEELTSRLIAQGLTDPKDWVNVPEVQTLVEFVMKPGSWFIHTAQEVTNTTLSAKTIDDLIKFLLFDENILVGKTVYYADERQYLSTPIISLNADEYLIPPFKLLIEAFYNRINAWLATTKSNKYLKAKNKALEEKTLQIFRNFFKSNASYYQTFYFDKSNRAEQDLLILYKDIALIIEIKDFKFRAPMREPIKAFDKIKSDFKGGIQKAYDQCKRMENALEIGNNFEIYDEKNNKLLWEVKPGKIRNWYSIIVTQHKYGGIQTNLSELLSKEQDALYPWSVCVDDLEIFLLGLLKIKRNSSSHNFINYLEYREYFHERLICSDELEMCGLFLIAQHKFRHYATQSEDYFATDIRMSGIFDAHYQNGLGFTDEINIQNKKKQPIGSYEKSFDVHIVSGHDMKD